MKQFLLILGIASILTACQQTHKQQNMIQQTDINTSVNNILSLHPDADTTLVKRGVEQVAQLWTKQDGNNEKFINLVSTYYAGNPTERQLLYNRLAYILEQCSQSADMLNNTLQDPTTLVDKGEPINIDWIISGFDPMAHFAEDMFANNIAHICILNFPHYTLKEKNTLGAQWTRQQWAYARMGDVFHTRMPGDVMATYAQVLSQTENYIATYNIMMHALRTNNGEALWKQPTTLLSHWNLRDEIKSNYTNSPQANQKQEMIYQVMLRIIRQEIPACVINNDNYLWEPYSNKVTQADKSINAEREPDTRYQQIINIFQALQNIDKHRPDAPSHLLRTFNEDLEIPIEELENLFIELIESDEIKQVGQLIKERVGRDLRPYDIWYDGFKSRSNISEEQLTAQTQQRYPTAKDFEKDIPRMLIDLGFCQEKAHNIASHIVVEPARGSGHARPCVGRKQPARLRTRINNKGMDYKGYNIAVHEFGHNVEEVISLYDIDYYTLAGIPNTGFTEASAFLFQQRDMKLLGYDTKKEAENENNTTLDMIWGMYEIMGVSLVDMRMWKWLYQNPQATAEQLREAVIDIAAEVWNQYYEPILGEKDSPLLAIYSHMVGYALYLPGYPIGQIVQYQLEEHLAQYTNPEDFAKEYTRIYQQGRLTPDAWMKGAVGAPMSVQPILKAVKNKLQQEQ